MKHRIVSVTDQSKHPLLIIVMLAWPIFVEQVLVSLVQSVDTAMVGALHQPKPDQPDQLGDHGAGCRLHHHDRPRGRRQAV